MRNFGIRIFINFAEFSEFLDVWILSPDERISKYFFDFSYINRLDFDKKFKFHALGMGGVRFVGSDWMGSDVKILGPLRKVFDLVVMPSQAPEQWGQNFSEVDPKFWHPIPSIHPPHPTHKSYPPYLGHEIWISCQNGVNLCRKSQRNIWKFAHREQEFKRPEILKIHQNVENHDCKIPHFQRKFQKIWKTLQIWLQIYIQQVSRNVQHFFWKNVEIQHFWMIWIKSSWWKRSISVVLEWFEVFFGKN